MSSQKILRSSEDQLYMIEFLVYELKIFSDQVEKVKDTLCVALKFADLPPFIISQNDFAHIKDSQPGLNTNEKVISFNIGKSCLFSRRSEELKKWIEERPLVINIYPNKSKDEDYQDKEDQNVEEDYGRIKIFLSECLGNLNSIFEKKDFGKVAEPIFVKNTCTLLDLLKHPFGSINFFLRFTCFGKLVCTKFALQDESFLFKTGQSENEFQCLKVPPEEKKNDSISESINDNSENKLEIKSDTESENDIYSYSESISEMKSNFESVAEIKSDFENKPEAESVSKIENNFVSENDISKSLETSNILGLNLACEDLIKTDEEPPLKIPNDKSSSLKLSIYKCLKKRNRDSKKHSSDSKNDNQDFKRLIACCENKWNKVRCPFQIYEERLFRKSARMRGGACEPKDHSSYDELNCSSSSDKSDDCCSSCDYISTSKAENSTPAPFSFQKCINEAQEILNSLGKKNGFAGLGIIGPDESPYFGRKKDFDFSLEVSDQLDNPSTLKNEKRKDAVRSKVKEEKPSDSFKLSSEDAVKRTFPKEQSSPDVINPPDIGISTMFQKTDSFTPSLGKKSCKRKKKRKKKIFKIPSFNSTATTLSKPPIKVSKQMMKHAATMREYSPGIYYGHRNCLDLNMRIPANMGWLWNTCDNPGMPKPRYGWKPGAISKQVYNLLMKAKTESGLRSAEEDSLASETVPVKKTRMPRAKSFIDSFKADEPPLVHVKRKDGDYYVTINPMGPGDAKPLQLKISKNPEADDNTSTSTAPDFQLACSPPDHSSFMPAVEKKDMDTQVKQQEISESLKAKAKEDTKKINAKKSDVKKADDKKSDFKKADVKKVADKRADDKTVGTKKTLNPKEGKVLKKNFNTRPEETK